MIEKYMAKIEQKILGSLKDKMEIVTELDDKTMILNTTSYWDGVEITNYEFDLEPIVEAVIKRMK